MHSKFPHPSHGNNNNNENGNNRNNSNGNNRGNNSNTDYGSSRNNTNSNNKYGNAYGLPSRSRCERDLSKLEHSGTKLWHCSGCHAGNRMDCVICSNCFNGTKAGSIDSSENDSVSKEQKEERPNVGGVGGAQILLMNSIDVNCNWSCRYCWYKNSNEQNVCILCKNKRNDASINNESKDNGDMITMDSNINDWECESCTLINDLNNSVCDACQTRRPHTVGIKCGSAIENTGKGGKYMYDSRLQYYSSHSIFGDLCETSLVKGIDDNGVIMSHDKELAGLWSEFMKTLQNVPQIAIKDFEIRKRRFALSFYNKDVCPYKWQFPFVDLCAKKGISPAFMTFVGMRKGFNIDTIIKLGTNMAELVKLYQLFYRTAIHMPDANNQKLKDFVSDIQHPNGKHDIFTVCLIADIFARGLSTELQKNIYKSCLNHCYCELKQYKDSINKLMTVNVNDIKEELAPNGTDIIYKYKQIDCIQKWKDLFPHCSILAKHVWLISDPLYECNKPENISQAAPYFADIAIE